MSSGAEMNGQKGVSEGDALKVVVIGAGIGGLSAAVFLREQGQNVEVRRA
jgi:succinate dehydrogenase/fumarate reductase flavoprotein subunit